MNASRLIIVLVALLICSFQTVMASNMGGAHVIGFIFICTFPFCFLYFILSVIFLIIKKYRKVKYFVLQMIFLIPISWIMLLLSSLISEGDTGSSNLVIYVINIIFFTIVFFIPLVQFLMREKKLTKNNMINNFKSVEEYVESLNLDCPVIEIKNEKYRDEILEHARILQDSLWQDHLKTLSLKIRKQLEDFSHPSLVCDFERSRDVLDEFERSYGLNEIEKIVLADYHGRIVFSIDLVKNITRKDMRELIPLYFQGFEIKVHNKFNKEQKAQGQAK